jgi:16S rRNA G1207 methylase RsmC
VKEVSSVLPLDTGIDRYKTKDVDFKFRGRAFQFALSHGLFSAADVDTGTRLLLKVFSKTLDEDLRQGNPPPKTILDAGCGVGIIGICAAAALCLTEDTVVRCQDRDELARLFTAYNARKNGIPSSRFSVHTEPLLGGNSQDRWDLILSNIPAKAGASVLIDFILRSAGLLTPSGRALIVVVNPLAGFFYAQIQQGGIPLLCRETLKEHTVFMYGSSSTQAEPIQGGGAFLRNYPAYHRCSNSYAIGNIAYTLDAVHGVGDFDTPNGTVLVAAKLTNRLQGTQYFPLEQSLAILIHEPGQGHFPVWLMEYLSKPAGDHTFVLAGRNILALEASRHNLKKTSNTIHIETCSVIDLGLYQEILLETIRPRKGYDFIVAFPDSVPQTNQLTALWQGLEGLLVPGGIAVLGFSGTEAERFDRKKLKTFARLWDGNRKGFRAMAYQKNSLDEKGFRLIRDLPNG